MVVDIRESSRTLCPSPSAELVDPGGKAEPRSLDGPGNHRRVEHEGEPELRIPPQYNQDVIAGELPAEITQVLAVT
ncbi:MULTISPECIES: hypothetical protein [Streptomyces]|uniref:Uncharacterized protein n=1 Tax=Streptomyces stelliscabiei TaxID=146820 RepID=A0A8I0TW68_9ACTN|nr:MULTISPECIES: hypothetical protein [Streptomyces]KND43115.1 hypothetical protein IQ64_19995 [Streptomyces stelliscabiei]MBE1602677.1 hypothetical protein [Streptomyces stelliscabiei]MDX2516885.1 hypothetical protein [Streptomyces stelliscabiei]MDX2550628.1 hypothetical protein [Streptomyces stelliscabiei]MDX2610326.1 hypothetical protein [Streptomyces stelliscabiei]